MASATPPRARSSWVQPVTRRVLGIVPEEAVRRHPSELWRMGVATLLVAISGVAALHVSTFEKIAYDLIVSLPSGLRDIFWVFYLMGTVAVAAGLGVAMLVARRFRLGLVLLAGAAIAALLSLSLDAIVDDEAALSAAGLDRYGLPSYPVVLLAVAAAVVLIASAYLTRPARLLVMALLGAAVASAILLTLGLAADVMGGLAVGWGVAAALRFAVGSPEGTPSIDKVVAALTELGLEASDLRLTPEQVWGEARFAAAAPDGTGLSVDVIGRDSNDARLLAKLWRFVWYKDSGPDVSLSRIGQLEHRAYLLLRAAQSGVPTDVVVAAGTAGEDADAILVLRPPIGTRLTELPADQVTDAVLVDAWQLADRLHGARLAHGSLSALNIVRQHDGTLALVDFTRASGAGSPGRLIADRVELLTTTAALVGVDRALAVAEQVLGPAGLGDLLSLLQPAALSPAARASIQDEKKLLESLRQQGAERAGVEEPTLVPLRRVSAANVLMATGAILGVYLLIAQFSDVPDLLEILKSAEMGWVGVTALLSQLPQIAGAFVMLGSVATALPFGPTLAVQFANNFTGFVAGSVGTTALIIRYFQRQGNTIAVAVSSGVLKTFSSMVVEVILVGICLIITWGDFTFSAGSDGSGGGAGSGDLLLILIIVVGVAVGIVVTVPNLRKRARGVVAPQVRSARDNLRQIMHMPVKAVELFGGNLASEVLFAMTLGAALHAYGESLPLAQLIVINSFASLLGGLAPIPGGMGVVEAGMIAGFTAAGVPQSDAVAATFTARLFTTYLPPIWGWFAMKWLRRRNLV